MTNQMQSVGGTLRMETVDTTHPRVQTIHSFTVNQLVNNPEDWMGASLVLVREGESVIEISNADDRDLTLFTTTCFLRLMESNPKLGLSLLEVLTESFCEGSERQGSSPRSGGDVVCNAPQSEGAERPNEPEAIF